jgi:hypothetical protein
MEVMCSFETMVSTYEFTGCHNPEHQHRHRKSSVQSKIALLLDLETFAGRCWKWLLNIVHSMRGNYPEISASALRKTGILRDCFSSSNTWYRTSLACCSSSVSRCAHQVQFKKTAFQIPLHHLLSPPHFTSLLRFLNVFCCFSLMWIKRKYKTFCIVTLAAIGLNISPTLTFSNSAFCPQSVCMSFVNGDYFHKQYYPVVDPSLETSWFRDLAEKVPSNCVYWRPLFNLFLSFN